jgi:DNA processing protein
MMKAAKGILPFTRGMETHDALFLLGLSHVEFLKPREKLLLIEMLGSAQRLFQLSLAEIGQLVGRRLFSKLWLPEEILRAATRTQNSLTESGARSIFYWDTTYPPQLREIFDPPVTLFLRGSLPDPEVPLAGIVGTRYPTGAAHSAAFRLGFDFGRSGVGVVSGLARGIDRDAHEGCVEAGGVSIAVLGNGIDELYPQSSRGVGMTLLARGGAILSEYPPGVPPLHYHFPARNRIISGLSRAVVVVQAPEKSGALITADYALEQGRDLWVHREGTTGAASGGTRKLAESGAPIATCAADLLREWGRGSCDAKPAHDLENLSTGARMARMLECEIDGSCALSGGEAYWRR